MLQLSDHRTPARIDAPPATPAKIGRDAFDALRDELAKYREEMCRLFGMEPREAFMKLSAWHARVSVMRATTYQSETRAATAFRTHEIDPFLSSCEFQFKVTSRNQAVVEGDMRLTRGGM